MTRYSNPTRKGYHLTSLTEVLNLALRMLAGQVPPSYIVLEDFLIWCQEENLSPNNQEVKTQFNQLKEILGEHIGSNNMQYL